MTGIVDGVRLATPTGALPDKDWVLLDNSAQFLYALLGLFQFHSSTLLPDAGQSAAS